ncbi:TPA: hypothetical protein ACGGCT_003460 [Acinetobacter baumannii]
MLSRPKYLFHGSTSYREYLEPKQAIGDGEMDNAIGIYAVEDKRIAQLFAIEYLGLSNDARFSIKFKDDFVYVELYQCSVNWDRIGYLYTLPPENFIKIDHMQWLSSESVIPTKVEPVNPHDFKTFIQQRSK